MSCLDNIVIVSGCDALTQSTSGYDLMKAPEITVKNLAKVANEKYVSGLQMARSILDASILDIKSDFLQILAANNYAVSVSAMTYSSSDFDTSKSYPATNKERGLVFYKRSHNGKSLRNAIIKSVSVLPLANVANAIIKIEDNGLIYSYPTTLTANLINTIDIYHPVNGPEAKVTVSGVNMPVASSKLICYDGCSGAKNECGHVKGYNGDGVIAMKEGYGVAIEFTCDCDYDRILCDLSRSFVGKLIYLKARIGLLDERLNTDRLNALVLYGAEEAAIKKAELEQEYTAQWDVFVKSMPKILQSYKGECISCRDIRIVTNV